MYFQKPPLGTPLDWENPLNKDLALHLAMNEGHGDKVQDLSMNGNHGSMTGFEFPPTAVSGWNPGQTGIGLNFNGTNAHIDCVNNPTLNPIGEITLGALVKPVGAGTGDWQSIISKRSGWGVNTMPFDLHRTDDDYYFSIYKNNHKTATAAGCVTLNEPQIVIGTYDGVHLKIYCNGILEGSTASTEGIPTNDHIIVIGNRADAIGADTHFNGSIDQPRIIAGARTAKEVMDYTINPWQVYLDEDD